MPGPPFGRSSDKFDTVLSPSLNLYMYNLWIFNIMIPKAFIQWHPIYSIIAKLVFKNSKKVILLKL